MRGVLYNPTEISEITFEVYAGSDIHSAVREALGISISKSQSVKFKFNDKLITITPAMIDELVQSVVTQQYHQKRERS